jgi:hypothetical protein
MSTRQRRRRAIATVAPTNRRPYLTSTVLLLAVTIPLTGLLLLTRTRRRQSRGSPANAACRREWHLGCHCLRIQMRFSVARRSWTRDAGSCVRRVSLQRCADADPRLDSRGPHLRHTPHAEIARNDSEARRHGVDTPATAVRRLQRITFRSMASSACRLPRSRLIEATASTRSMRLYFSRQSLAAMPLSRAISSHVWA